jgi:hypothetical protein
VTAVASLVGIVQARAPHRCYVLPEQHPAGLTGIYVPHQYAADGTVVSWQYWGRFADRTVKAAIEAEALKIGAMESSDGVPGLPPKRVCASLESTWT